MYKEKSVDVFPKETYKVSDKLTIEAVPLEFYRGDVLDKHGDALDKAIRESDGVIFEYFPPEIAEVRKNKLAQAVTNVEWFQDYYDFAAKKALEYNKPVIAMDPAHDVSFSVIRGLPAVAVLGAYGSFLSAGLIYSLGEKGKISTKGVKVGTSAAFVSAIALGLVGYITRARLRREHKKQMPTEGPSESNFRRVVVAKGIQNFSKQLSEIPNEGPKKLLLLYPPVHWKGIKRYLDDTKKLDRAFHIASAFKVGGLKDSCFSIRTYQPSMGKFELNSKVEIV